MNNIHSAVYIFIFRTTNTSSMISIEPPSDENGLSELLLTVDNQTPQTFHTMKDLQLAGDFYVPSIDRKVRIDFAKQGPIEIDITTHSQSTVTFSALAEDIYAYYSRHPLPFSLSLSLDDKHYEHTLGYNKELEYRTLNTPLPFRFGRPSNRTNQPLLSHSPIKYAIASIMNISATVRACASFPSSMI